MMMMRRRMSICSSLCVILIILGTNYTRIIEAAGSNNISYTTNSNSSSSSFDENYVTDWGDHHISFLDGRRQVQILIDQTSGGGFRSKHAYGSGYFQISLQVPKNATGIVTTFYLTSIVDDAAGGNGNHDELDFELLLGRHNNNHLAPNYILNTNVFAQDSGHREQQFNLWFDPTSSFHNYGILWNPKQIVFYIDKTPIRVLKNMTNIGAKYPKLPMYVHATLWNGSQWLGPTNWSLGPFYANYRGFDQITACSPAAGRRGSSCASWKYPWNKWELTVEMEKVIEMVKNKHIGYDYCKSDKANTTFPECNF